MRLIHVSLDGTKTPVPREQSTLTLLRITGGSAMILDAMKGGVPCRSTDGDYYLVNEDLTPINFKNF